MLKSIEGDIVGDGVNMKKLMLLEHARGIIQGVCAIPPTTEVVGILARF